MAEWHGVYVVTLIGSILIPMALAIYAWLRRTTPGALPFVWMMASAAFAALCYLGLAISPNPDVSFFWARLRFLGASAFAVSGTLFLMAYIGRDVWLKPRRLLWLLIIPAISQITIWTNHWHHNFFTNWELEDKGLLSIEMARFGIWYWLHAIYSYGIVAAAIWMLCATYLRSKGVFRQQAARMLLGALLAILISLPSGLGIMEAPLNTLPLGVIIAGLYFTWALFRFGLLDLMPVAHSTIFRSINDAAIVLDSQDRIVEVNPAALRLFGKTEQDLIGQPAGTVFAEDGHLTHWDSSALDTQELIALGNSDQSRNYELRASPLLHQDTQIGRLILLQEVTERRQAEDALRASESRFRLLVDNLPTIVFIFQDGEIAYVNPAVETVTGYSAERILQEGYWALLNPEAQALTKETIRKAASGDIPENYRYDINVIARSGQTRTLHVSLIPLNYEGNPALLGTAMDITGQRQSERQKMDLVMERKRVQILTTFITQASHEFRTPLSTINTSTYLLKNATDPAVQQRHIDTIEAQVNTISDLVSALITMSRLDSGQEIKVRAIDLCQLITNIINTRQTTLEAKNIGSDVQGHTESIMLQADAIYLKMAFESLIDNAIQFTDSGGTITVCLKQAEDHVIVEITDTGCGINDTDLPHIFERFYRADKAGTTRGFGLGLPIARTIISLHRGSIDVESEPGKGSTFRVALPVE